jgi:hypothetical protein
LSSLDPILPFQDAAYQHLEGDKDAILEAINQFELDHERSKRICRGLMGEEKAFIF